MKFSQTNNREESRQNIESPNQAGRQRKLISLRWKVGVGWRGVRVSVDDIKTGQYVEIINALVSSEGLRDVVLETQEIIITRV